MKKLAIVFLCFFASNAFASKPDSGICPWKMPFTVNVQGYGRTHSSVSHIVSGYISYDTDYGYQLSSELFQVTVDTLLGEHYSLVNDTLMFSDWLLQTGPPYYHSAHVSLNIVFAKNKDSIISLSYSELDTGITLSGDGSWAYEKYDFQLSAALFDDTSIFFSDSSITAHNFLMTDSDIISEFIPNNDSETKYFQFTASSVTLSGIFRPTTFSNPPAIVTEAPQPNNLAIYSSNGSIAFSFDVSDHAIDLEIFSPLGIREASFSIPAGQTEASLPHLPAGFYFVRLEGSMAKVYISD